MERHRMIKERKGNFYLDFIVVLQIILNFVAEMDKLETYKERIDAILIRGKGYLAPDFSAQQLAEEMGISAFALSRLLKTIYGQDHLWHVVQRHCAHLPHSRCDAPPEG